MENIPIYNIKEYLNSLLLSIVNSSNDEFLRRYEELINKKYLVNFITDNLVFQFIVNRITNTNVERGELCSSTLKKYVNKSIKPILEEEENKKCKHSIYTEYYNIFNEKLKEKQKELISKNDNIYINSIKKLDLNCGFLNISLKDKNDLKFFETEQTKDQNKNELSYEFVPIGYLESCFPEKFSVPRQGNLLQLTKAKIIFSNNIDINCLDGIELFQYFWIIYVFHLHQEFTKTKIAPPKFKGKKLGIYATRSPHRLNPIGLTLAKLEKIDKNELYFSGVDMVSGTPILDIKPYHHLESIPITPSLKYPDWIKNEAENPILINVEFTDIALNQIKEILLTKKLKFYDNFDEIVALIKGILEINPHSKYDNTKKAKLLYAFYVDMLNVIYEYDSDQKSIRVLKIEYITEYKKLRTKSWLKENYNEIYNKQMEEENEEIDKTNI